MAPGNLKSKVSGIFQRTKLISKTLKFYKNPILKVDNPTQQNNPYSCMKRVTGDTHVGGLIRDIVETLHNIPELPFKARFFQLSQFTDIFLLDFIQLYI